MARRLPTSALTRRGAAAAEGSAEREELYEALSDVEAGMEEILPRDARMALLDYKPGDVVITPTGRGWHIVKVFFPVCCLERAAQLSRGVLERAAQFTCRVWIEPRSCGVAQVQRVVRLSRTVAACWNELRSSRVSPLNEPRSYRVFFGTRRAVTACTLSLIHI